MKTLWKIISVSAIILIFILINSSLNYDVSAKPPLDKTEEELIKIDKEFSEKSYTDGILSAFLEYASDDAIIFREKSFPIVGKKELMETYKSEQSSDVKLSWIPTKAEVSESNDLGYTYGEWKYISLNKKGYPMTKFGYYVTVWEKQKEGVWKFVLYCGNSTDDNIAKFKKLQ
jgi:ketosteroid isomerase-like protein